ncbi:MAG: hypothetical protein HFI44_09625 [Lachnospiraceae bacterium]|nr:hypothetical protein [Lachnospiraceae bacterium]GFI02722.1 hypothetical protein IMSAGC005_01553 [Lachnospiraceae bacterium]
MLKTFASGEVKDLKGPVLQDRTLANMREDVAVVHRSLFQKINGGNNHGIK